MDDGWGSDEWVYRSPCYRALNLSFGLRSTEPEVGAYLDRVLSALRCDDEGEAPDVWYSITHGNSDPKATTTLHFGSELVVRAHSTAFAIETMLWHLNGATEDRADPFVVLHAAGVALDGAGAIISGPSGAGKTTLTAALARGVRLPYGRSARDRPGLRPAPAIPEGAFDQEGVVGAPSRPPAAAIRPLASGLARRSGGHQTRCGGGSNAAVVGAAPTCGWTG